jgi:hypothetical protein
MYPAGGNMLKSPHDAIDKKHYGGISGGLVRGREHSTMRFVVDIEAAARAGLDVKLDLADLQILYFVGRSALDASGGGDAPGGVVDAGFGRVKEVFAHLGILSEEEYAARIEALSSIGAIEVHCGGKAAPQSDAAAKPQLDAAAEPQSDAAAELQIDVAAAPPGSIMVRLSERVSGAGLFPTLAAAAPLSDATATPRPAGGRRGFSATPTSAAVQALLREDESKRRLGLIAAYLDSEYDMGEPVSLSEFLDLCMGIIRGECDTAGMHVGGVYDSVYDPKSLKSIRAALAAVYNAVSVIAPVLDAIGALGVRPPASVWVRQIDATAEPRLDATAEPHLDATAAPHLDTVVAPCRHQLDVEQFRELLTDYIKDFSKRLRARDVDHAEIEDFAAPEAVAAFTESVEAYSPGDPPHFYVETVLGCGPR